MRVIFSDIEIRSQNREEVAVLVAVGLVDNPRQKLGCINQIHAKSNLNLRRKFKLNSEIQDLPFKESLSDHINTDDAVPRCPIIDFNQRFRLSEYL